MGPPGLQTSPCFISTLCIFRASTTHLQPGACHGLWPVLLWIAAGVYGPQRWACPLERGLTVSGSVRMQLTPGAGSSCVAVLLTAFSLPAHSTRPPEQRKPCSTATLLHLSQAPSSPQQGEKYLNLPQTHSQETC